MTRLCISYIYSCFRYTHGVLHDTVFDTESGEGWSQAAESLNLPYLDVIRIVSHYVYGTWDGKPEIHESMQFWLGRLVISLGVISTVLIMLLIM